MTDEQAAELLSAMEDVSSNLILLLAGQAETNELLRDISTQLAQAADHD